MESVRVFKVFVSSPSDLKEERMKIMNYINTLRIGDFIFNAVLWEKDLPATTFDNEKGAQGLIDDLLLRNCDILLGSFRLHFGSITYNNESGTSAEIIESINNKIPVILYFWDVNKSLNDLTDSEIDSFRKIRKFKEDFKNKGYYRNIENFDDFKDKIKMDLEYNAKRLIGLKPITLPTTTSIINISEKGLQIYRTGNLENYERNESLKYEWEDGKYVLNNFKRGKTYKHFVLCTEQEKWKVENILNSSGLYEVTGNGSMDEGSGKIRVWFLIKSADTEGEGVFRNNIEAN